MQPSLVNLKLNEILVNKIVLISFFTVKNKRNRTSTTSTSHLAEY